MEKFVALVLAVLALAAIARSEGATCNTIQLAPCLSAVQKGGATKTPSPSCCSNIKKFTPKCLCDSVQSSLAQKYNVDIPTALTIPKRCNVNFNVPPDYTCAGYQVPREVPT
ncbi:non-specific lipid-transfer protein 2-like [Selaginella moellendorffii]|uniref:non-specific lipid-transfer protein 2-like n=1 Tax=Selaginella moellendorffii TaxID=88036 RepID=UPI000D1C8C0C|nr:non-specific lipid-transfer protein 2-like [Selaginella moellendorffii]|eukprot:XP_024545585.1 non-specific lipid-transfer protein 2-like [Selaginella moellendorffii]